MIQKFGSRVVSFHVKDMVASGIRPDCGDGDQRTVGQGGINFAPMLASAKGKTKYYFAERDPVGLGGATNFNPFRNSAESAIAMKGDPAPSLKASPTLFSSVPKGTPASANQVPIKVTNDGNAPLVIHNGDNAIRILADADDGGAATAADFLVVSEDCRGKTLAPNASCTLNVGYKPTRSNFTSVARIVIESNSDDAVEQILITGTQTPPKVLVFHGPPTPTDDRGRRRDQGARHGERLRRRRRPRTRPTFTAANLANYRAVVFLNNAGRPAQRRAGDRAAGATSRAAAASSASARPPRPSPAARSSTGLIGARPDAAQLDDRVRPGRRRSATACTRPPRTCRCEWTRTDVWYRWTTRPTGTVHTVARYRAPGAAAGDGTDHGRHRLADLLVPRLPAAAAPSTPAWAGPPASLRRGQLQEAPARRHPVGRGPRPRRLQGDDHCPTTRARAHRQRRRAGDLTTTRRVARRRRWPTTAG